MMHRPLVRIVTILAVGLVAGSGRSPIRLSAQPQPRAQTAPAGQTRTRLADGRWLLVGGEGSGGSASIWDPATQTASPTPGHPAVPRAWHTSTLLSDGTVLLAGGKQARGPVDTTEIFEPASGTFRQLSIAGTVARAFQTATLLIDGRVLVVGGAGEGITALGTELWDLTTQTATTVGAAGIDRVGHTATLTADGTVLVAGGKTLDGQPAPDPLVVDPASGAVVRQRGNPEQEPPPIVAASIPSSGAEDVPVDTRVAVRLSVAVAAESLNTDTITLSGPDGVVTTAIVAAEEGRLAVRASIASVAMRLVQAPTDRRNRPVRSVRA